MFQLFRKLSLCLLFLSAVPAALVADNRIRFVAADRKGRPLVSDLVSFRRSPYGGLIATQWASNARIGAKPLFPVRSDDPLLAEPDTLPLVDGLKSDDPAKDLLDELTPKKAKTIRPVDVVDRLYQEVTLSDGRKVGPRRNRVSEAQVAAARGAILPGAIEFNGETDVLCYPVTITARRGLDYVPFTPRLFFKGYDLLQDCLFEHSPEMPLGDAAGWQAASGLQAWLTATRGGKRDFRKLTIYLPMSSQPYRLDGHEFTVNPEGLEIATNDQVQKVGPFELQIQVATEPGPEAPTPVIANETTIEFSVPDVPDGAIDGQLFAAGRRGVMADVRHEVRLTPVSSNKLTGTLPENLEPGLYVLELDGLAGLRLPVLVGTDRFDGSVSLFTHHNRCDYLRGENVHLGVMLRGEGEATPDAQLVLRHESGEELTVASQLNAFHPIDTSALRLGRYNVTLRTAEKLLIYDTWFTVHPATQRTDFALYSWFSNSFSGPIIVGDQPVANIALSQKPSQFLTPSQLDRLTSQPVYPPSMADHFRSHPLFPAVETTESYDPDTEREAAITMRLGMRYCPDYGWGLNGQEAGWNPKHTLPEDLARMQRLCSQVTQRHREFGNVSGLHFNWYPRLNGNWEGGHPPTDGNAGPRRELLDQQVAERKGLDAVKYRVGAFSRAYDAWTRRAKTFTPTLTGSPIYTSFVPVSWFRQVNYHPPSFHASLPVAGIHAYTDYGFSPFQPLWGLEHWGSGLGDKPRWVTTMSNGRDIMLRHALLLAGRGAAGIDIKGLDDRSARVISEFLTRYGSFFRQLKPHSDVAIITSLNQSWTKELYGRWMGYTGGEYYQLFSHLWYSRRPPAMIPDEDVTLETLSQFKAVFLLGKDHLAPQDVLDQYAASGGKVIRDPFLGATGETDWEPKKYKQTRDAYFVGMQASYERTRPALDRLLSDLEPPMVDSDTHEVMLTTLKGDDVSVVFAVNDRRTPPGIHHDWNFWSATVLAARHELTFDEPYVLYDLTEGGKEIRLTEQRGNRYVLPVSFDRGAGRVFLVTKAPIETLTIDTVPETAGGVISVSTNVETAAGRPGHWPCEIAVINDRDEVVQTFYRGIGRHEVTIPRSAGPGEWKVRVTELASGLTATATIQKTGDSQIQAAPSRAWMRHPDEVAAFLNRKTPVWIVIDERQSEDVRKLAEVLKALVGMFGRRFDVEIQVVRDLDVHEFPLRWRQNAVNAADLKAARTGRTILTATDRQSFVHDENGRLDVVHPNAGWQEPGAHHRMYRDVILLGDVATNRFLADLHATVGIQSDRPTVQVIHDAFTPDHDCLSIQASDIEGLRKGVQTALASSEPRQSEDPRPPSGDGSYSTKSTVRRELFNPVSDDFGASVHPMVELPDGGLFVSAGTNAANYFVLNADGSLQTKWLGKHGGRIDRDGRGYWLDTFWGAPGYVNTLVRANADRQPAWIMTLPRFSKSYRGWRHSGKRIIRDRSSKDIFVSGQRQVSRITPDGKVVWQYDDTPSIRSVDEFRFSRDLMLQDVSPDGRHLLVAAFGIEPYANFVSKFHRPSVMLIDAESGRVLWEKTGITIDHSVCRFADSNQIVAGDAESNPKRLMMLDLTGKELQSLDRPDGTSVAFAAGDWLIVRPEAPRGANRQTIGQPQGLTALKRDGSSERPFPLSALVHSFRFDDRLYVSTVDGRLCCFEPDTSLVWERQLSSPCQLLVARHLYAGTQTGHLLRIDRETGETLRETDLMPHNVVTDPAAYVRDYTNVPDEAPVMSPAPALPPRIDKRCGKQVTFAAHSGLEFTAKPGTHVISFLQRGQSGDSISVTAVARGKTVYQAQISTSLDWRERNAAFRLASPERVKVRITGAEIKDATAFHVTFGSPNRLLQAEPKFDGVDFESTTRKKQKSVASSRFLIPNDVNLQARSSGAPPFPAVIAPSVPFDGVLRGQKTSWLGKPVNGSTHVRMEVTLGQPVEVTSLALFGDTDTQNGLSRSFALLCRNAESKEWFQAGVRFDNASPFNLFTFEKTGIDQISYVQLSSQDGHARVAELEAYGQDDPLADLLD